MKTVNKILFHTLIFTLVTVNAELITDGFDSLNTEIWKSEYRYPEVSGGFARFTLQPGDVNTTDTWSKLSYRNSDFRYGTYSMTFRYSRRPLEAEVWAGWALYTETADGINEINFGIETACQQRCDDSTLILESYKNSNNNEVIVPAGVSLFDGIWHTVELTFTESEITLFFDGELMAAITDLNTIPAVEMSLIPGARVVSGRLDSNFYMDIDSLSISDSTAPTSVIHKHNFITKPARFNNAFISVTNLAGRELYSITTGEINSDLSKIKFNDFINGSGVYIVRINSQNFTWRKKILLE